MVILFLAFSSDRCRHWLLVLYERNNRGLRLEWSLEWHFWSIYIVANSLTTKGICKFHSLWNLHYWSCINKTFIYLSFTLPPWLHLRFKYVVTTNLLFEINNSICPIILSYHINNIVLSIAFLWSLIMYASLYTTLLCNFILSISPNTTNLPSAQWTLFPRVYLNNKNKNMCTLKLICSACYQ